MKKLRYFRSGGANYNPKLFTIEEVFLGNAKKDDSIDLGDFTLVSDNLFKAGLGFGCHASAPIVSASPFPGANRECGACLTKGFWIDSVAFG
jgi:hypothetical protein